MSYYTVREARGCKVIEGAVPISDFTALVTAWDTGGWIVDSLLTQALGAAFVLGPCEACLAWRAELQLEVPAMENKPGL